MNSRAYHRGRSILKRLIALEMLFIFLWLLWELLFLVIIGYILIVCYMFVIYPPYIKWLKKGREHSKELQLQRLLVIESDIIGLACYEVHHKESSFGQILASVNPKKQLHQELREDFHKIHQWSMNRILVTTTHKGMINTWEKTSEGLFDVVVLPEVIDPYASMSYLQWIKASFLTTRKIRLDRPKIWSSFRFVRREVANRIS